MTKFQVLYYPNFWPSQEWVRSHLLFFDTIYSIVPKDPSIDPPSYVYEITDKLPGSCKTIPPDHKYINNIDMTLLEAAFRLIQEDQKSPTSGLTTIRSHQYGIWDIGNVSIHLTKIAPDIEDLLNRTELVHKKEKHLNADYLTINSKAANLIVSLISDDIGRRKGINTITDMPLEYSVSLFNSYKFKSINDPRTLLAKSLINCEIPYQIGQIPFSDYLKIRTAYKNIRTPFHELINEISSIYQLNSIEDTNELKLRIEDITTDINDEIQRIKKQSFCETLKRWIPIGISGFGTIAGSITVDPLMLMTTNSISFGIQVLKELKYKAPNDRHDNIKRMIGNLQNDLLKPSFANKLVI